MSEQENIEAELTPQELDALNMLIGPGPLEENGIFRNPWQATHSPRWMDIPATSVMPSSPPSDAELLNMLKTAKYLDIPDGEIAFNPIREYHTYLQLFNKGVVNMRPTEQGSNKVIVKITPDGARRLGKELVEEVQK